MAEELADQVTTESVSPPTSAPETSAPSEGVRSEGQLGDKTERTDRKRSVREDLIAAVKEEKAKAEKPSASPATEAKTEDGDRARGPDGKFLPKDTAAPEKAATDKQIPSATEAKLSIQQPSSVASGPPSGWSKESKAAWTAMPPSVQSDVLRREQEIAAGQQKYQQTIASYQDIEKVLAPRRNAIRGYGVSEADYLNQLASWHEALVANPAVAFPALARSYGFDPSNQVPQSQNPSSDQDALTASLQPFLNPVMQQVKQVEGELQRLRDERVASEITSFAKDKPHFEKVRTVMARLMMGGEVDPNDLQGAYDKAIWLDPEIRNQLNAAEFEKQVKEQKDRAEKARQASVSTVSRSPSGPVTNGATNPKGVRASILAAMEEVRDKARA